MRASLCVSVHLAAFQRKTSCNEDEGMEDKGLSERDKDTERKKMNEGMALRNLWGRRLGKKHGVRLSERGHE